MAEPDAFLAPGSGLVLGRRANLRAGLADATLDARAALLREGPRLDRAAAAGPRRRVLVLAIERTDVPGLLGAARAELLRSRHDVELVVGEAGDRGSSRTCGELLADRVPAADPAAVPDWLLVIDDDVALPGGFLDRFVFLAERFDLRLAQPAHRHRSTPRGRSRAAGPDLARWTRFVEIGPGTAFRRDTFDVLLPFPPLRMGWGLDSHWARSRATVAGRSGSSTPRRSATACAAPAAATRTPTRSPRRGLTCMASPSSTAPTPGGRSHRSGAGDAKLSPVRALVTGGAGFIGSNLVEPSGPR